MEGAFQVELEPVQRSCGRNESEALEELNEEKREGRLDQWRESLRNGVRIEM